MHALLLATLLNTAQIDRMVRQVMRAQHVAGASIGIGRSGRVLYARGFGTANIGARIPATAETIYRIGSLTKPFTAQAVVRLADAGRIGLQQSVTAYVPVPQYGGITVEQLLQQRSGLPSYTDSPALDMHAVYEPAQLVAAVASQPPHFPPGTQYEYSNTNYALLGMLIESVSGMTYASYVREAILEPQGLQYTRYGDAPGEARGYARDTLMMPVARSSVSYAYAAAALSSNVPDLLKWMPSAREPYYGFRRGDMYGYDVRYATGNVPGYSAFEALVPATGDEIVVLTNADTVDLAPLARSIVAFLERPTSAYRARTLLEQLQSATLDRGVLTARYRAALSGEQLRLWQTQLAPLGLLTSVVEMGTSPAQRCTEERFRALFSGGKQADLQLCSTASGAVDDIRVTIP